MPAAGPDFQAGGNKIKAGRNEIQIRRNKIKGRRNKIKMHFVAGDSAISDAYVPIWALAGLNAPSAPQASDPSRVDPEARTRGQWPE